MPQYSYSLFQKLPGSRLTLYRLANEDIPEAADSLFSPTTWVVAVRGMDTKEKLYTYLQGFVEKAARGEGLTLVARINGSKEVAAISQFHSAGPGFRRVEIGFTWVADKFQRTFVNTEMKYLMIQYAFETMGVKRVEFSVDPTNEKSKRAMERIGATLEGTLRKWRFLDEKDQGHRCIYSIIDDEWPSVKARCIRLIHD